MMVRRKGQFTYPLPPIPPIALRPSPISDTISRARHLQSACFLSKGVNCSGSLTNVVLYSQFYNGDAFIKPERTMQMSRKEPELIFRSGFDNSVKKSTCIDWNTRMISTGFYRHIFVSWYLQGFISVYAYFTMAQGEEDSSVVTTLPDTGKYSNWFNLNSFLSESLMNYKSRES